MLDPSEMLWKWR